MLTKIMDWILGIKRCKDCGKIKEVTIYNLCWNCMELRKKEYDKIHEKWLKSYSKTLKGGRKMVNLNELARKITLKEGGKKNLNIGDVKEVMKLAYTELARMSAKDVVGILNKYKSNKKYFYTVGYHIDKESKERRGKK